MTDTPEPLSAAVLLRNARLQRELTPDQVTAQTRIPADMVLALEEKRWSALPGAPYARAFARTLAVAYELDPEQVLAGLRLDMGEGPAVTTPAVGVTVPTSIEVKTENRAPLILAAIIGLALILVIAATRLIFQASPGTSHSPADSLASDTVVTEVAKDTTRRKVAPPPPAPPQPVRRTATLSSPDSLHTGSVLYIRHGIRKIRKKTLAPTDSMEFDPDTGIYVRNLTGRPVRLTGAVHKDTVAYAFFHVYRKSDSVRLEKIDEDDWDAMADPILKKHKKQE